MFNAEHRFAHANGPIASLFIAVISRLSYVKCLIVSLIMEIANDWDIFEDDFDILEIIDFGFPRQIYQRSQYFDSLDELGFYRRFR